MILIDDDIKDILKVCFEGEYGVSVPRSVWISIKTTWAMMAIQLVHASTLWLSTLLQKAEKIGIPEGGVISALNANTTLMSDIDRL